MLKPLLVESRKFVPHFLKQLWNAITLAPTTGSSSSPGEPQSPPPSTSQVTELPHARRPRREELPSFEHTPLPRRANVITKMESGLGRSLSDTERASVLNKAQADKRDKSKQ